LLGCAPRNLHALRLGELHRQVARGAAEQEDGGKAKAKGHARHRS